MKRTLPLIYRIPLAILTVGLVTSAVTGTLVVLGLKDNIANWERVSTVKELILPLLLSAALLSGTGILLARRITHPLKNVQDAVARLAGRDYQGEIPAVDRSDEIGTVARVLVTLRDDLAEREITISAQASILDAIGRSQGMIEFDPRGRILSVNQNQLDVMGYTEAEIIGRPHSTFVEPDFAKSDDYRRMWDGLAAGRPVAGTFKRLAKDGRVVYLQGAYSPVTDASGAVVRVIKVASDVTAAESERLSLERDAREQAAIIDAIAGGTQGMIEFDAKGRILRANQALLDSMGYTEAEILGRHHSTFAEPEFADSSEYRRMWDALANGEPLRGTFKRLGKGGRTVYLQGSYSPVRDTSGNVVRVVKVVSDITKAETERLDGIERRAAIEAERARVVERLSGSLSELADGDLTVRLHDAFAPEYEGLRANFNQAIERLEDALSSVMFSADNIRNESVQIAHAADELSHRTENQAAALEQTAASLEELTSSVKAAAQSAEQANKGVDSTRQSAEASGRIVREAVGAMSEIEKSSGHISQIIGVIDDIAFQTNLLALNAGVEAARAGDAGRGFAVVASEVRALAQRSSDAAKEIKALISTSSQQVGRGVDLVRETGKSLETIVGSVAGITILVGEIASSAKEQSIGLTEISTAVNQLDQVTQQNAAMVEESTAASHAMKFEAESLATMVSQFKANVEHRPTPTAARTPARARASHKDASIPRTNGSAALALKSRDPLEDWQDF